MGSVKTGKTTNEDLFLYDLCGLWRQAEIYRKIPEKIPDIIIEPMPLSDLTALEYNLNEKVTERHLLYWLWLKSLF